MRQEVDAAGALLDAREWTPYGVEVGDTQSGLGYTGEWFDADVGLQYLRARWYDVEVGRFTSEDPLELEPNLYTYVQANPLSYTDPSGYFSPELIAESIGKNDFDQVVDWFADINNELHQRWGFLALLLHANSGDRITGLSLRVSGRKNKIVLGEFLSNGCNIQVMTEGKLHDLSDYIQGYLEDIEASDDNRMQYEVPNWRSVIHGYQLNGGEIFQDEYTDLPDWYATSVELDGHLFPYFCAYRRCFYSGLKSQTHIEAVSIRQTGVRGTSPST